MLSTTAMYTFDTYNTSDNLTNQMWMRCTSSIPTFSAVSTIPKSFKAKISCDAAALSFSTTGITQNLNVAASTSWPAYPVNAIIDSITITEGKITLNSVTMPSLVKSDRISFKLAKTKVPGVTYLVEGYRRTRWNEDETFITFQ